MSDRLERLVRHKASLILGETSDHLTVSEVLSRVVAHHKVVYDRLRKVFSNLNLRSCAECGHYHQPGHSCYECGYDRTAVEDDES